MKKLNRIFKINDEWELVKDALDPENYPVCVFHKNCALSSSDKFLFNHEWVFKEGTITQCNESTTNCFYCDKTIPNKVRKARKFFWNLNEF